MILIWRHPSQGTQSPESLFDSFHFVVDGSFEIQPFTSWGLTYFFPIIYRVLEHHPTGDLFGTPESTNVSRPPLDDVSVEPRSGRFIQKKNEEMEWMLSKTTVETSEILEHFQRSYTFFQKFFYPVYHRVLESKCRFKDWITWDRFASRPISEDMKL